MDGIDFTDIIDVGGANVEGDEEDVSVLLGLIDFIIKNRVVNVSLIAFIHTSFKRRREEIVLATINSVGVRKGQNFNVDNVYGTGDVHIKMVSTVPVHLDAKTKKV